MKRRLPLVGLYRYVPLEEEAPRACRECPWRFTNHGNPERFGGDAARWTNLTLLEGGGDPTTCHMTGVDADPGAPIERTARSRSCAGTLAVQQRALIRYLLDGDTSLPDEVRANLLARFLGGEPADHKAAARRLIASAHPGVFDPELGCSLVPAPTAGEVARWRALAIKTG